MKILAKLLVNGVKSSRSLEIDAGEPLAIPLQNPDGSPWDTTGVTARTTNRATDQRVSPEPFAIVGGALQLSEAASAALPPGQYVVQVWKDTDSLAGDGCADVSLTVY